MTTRLYGACSAAHGLCSTLPTRRCVDSQQQPSVVVATVIIPMLWAWEWRLREVNCVPRPRREEEAELGFRVSLTPELTRYCLPQPGQCSSLTTGRPGFGPLLREAF